VASDGSILSTYGIPAITYGPGGISREESYYDMLNQESVSIENLENCIRVYALAAQSICTKTMDEVSSASW
jgi:acetylornithine deacetylase/succinyl-diaminopimelate desuccinylase-like protein